MKSGLEPDRAVVVRDRFVVPPGACEREAEAVVHRCRLRPELRGGAVLRDRLVEPAFLAQRIAEIEPRRRVIGIERDRARPVVGGFAPPPERREREPDIVVKVRLLLARERTADQVDGLLMAPGRMGERAAQMQRMRVRSAPRRELRRRGGLLRRAGRPDGGVPRRRRLRRESCAARKRGSSPKSILDFHLEQRRAQGLAVRVDRRARSSRRRRAHACRRTAARRDAAIHIASPRP